MESGLQLSEKLRRLIWSKFLDNKQKLDFVRREEDKSDLENSTYFDDVDTRGIVHFGQDEKFLKGLFVAA
tara:strand:- start:407 stop:616 length:210 start_codon:yes stop_codon:yes gene_type:complete